MNVPLFHDFVIFYLSLEVAGPSLSAAFRIPKGKTILNDSISAANRIRQLSNPVSRSAFFSFPLVLLPTLALPLEDRRRRLQRERFSYVQTERTDRRKDVGNNEVLLR